MAQCAAQALCAGELAEAQIAMPSTGAISTVKSNPHEMSFPNRINDLYTRIRPSPVMKITGQECGPEIRKKQRALRRSRGLNEFAATAV
jgi:hypothetical protein